MAKKKAGASADEASTPGGIEFRLRQHIDRLHEHTKGSPGGDGLRALSSELLATSMLSWAVAAIAAKLPARTGVSSEGCDFDDWYVAVTVCSEVDPPSVAAEMPGGYLAYMNDVTAPAWAHPSGRKVAHWIYCYDGERCGVHLTMIPNPHLPRTSPPLIAQDLLTTAERRQLNITSAG
jgi:hypothetical protein